MTVVSPDVPIAESVAAQGSGVAAERFGEPEGCFTSGGGESVKRGVILPYVQEAACGTSRRFGQHLASIQTRVDTPDEADLSASLALGAL
jgi:hypothetical protein